MSSADAAPAVLCEVVQEDDNKAIALLNELGLASTTYSHPHLFTVEEQNSLGSILQGDFTKNLFIRDKKHGLYLVTVMSHQEVNLKTLASKLGLAGANFRFGDETLLQEKLQISRGCVGPLALINDQSNEIKFVLDQSLSNSDLVNSHPLRNDRTTAISSASLLAYCRHLNHEPILVDFSTISESKVEVKEKKQEKKTEESESSKQVKKETQLGLSVTKEEDFPLWYTQVITLSEMIDYSDISGCYVLRPWAYFIWEQIQHYMDERLRQWGVKNSYFPMFVSQRALMTEKDHVEGFAPEVAWVTKSGETDLAEPIAVRPTSETIMYPFFSKWIRSHRDLPLEINQWCNVVRWEFKDATPFLRSREFLWQEGHTAHTTYEEAQNRVMLALELYREVYEELLAVPVIKGAKTEMEKFAGGFQTTTVEAYINGSGRAIQGATSHNLGQNFGKMFKIAFEPASGGDRMIPWQTSWGLTTRTIGVAVMVHGDNKGLILPPRVAPIQVIILPIAKKDVEYDTLLSYSRGIEDQIRSVGIRVEIDERQNYTPGWKFNHWEQKGVPLRLEVGARDVSSSQCRLVRRDTGAKFDVPLENLGSYISSLLDEIQRSLFEKSKRERDEKIVQVWEWKDFVPALNRHCLVLTPFCDLTEWEEKVKKMSREEALSGGQEDARTATSVAGKTLCKPFDQPPLPEGTLCFVSGLPATTWVLWGRSY